jgi:catechol 2,3-dioxygenase-like lactoylglutathione lyase family enzyme
LIRIGSIVLRVDDLQRQTEFWQAALDYERHDMDHDFIQLRPRDGVGPSLSLDQVPSTVQVPPRLHLDLFTEDQTGEVERLPDADYVILADPEGNRFCVVDISR